MYAGFREMMRSATACALAWVKTVMVVLSGSLRGPLLPVTVQAQTKYGQPRTDWREEEEREEEAEEEEERKSYSYVHLQRRSGRRAAKIPV